MPFNLTGSINTEKFSTPLTNQATQYTMKHNEMSEEDVQRAAHDVHFSVVRTWREFFRVRSWRANFLLPKVEPETVGYLRPSWTASLTTSKAKLQVHSVQKL
jgi:hypothetical protein